jgi:hypothetical protein
MNVSCALAAVRFKRVLLWCFRFWEENFFAEAMGQAYQDLYTAVALIRFSGGGFSVRTVLDMQVQQP